MTIDISLHSKFNKISYCYTVNKYNFSDENH